MIVGNEVLFVMAVVGLPTEIDWLWYTEQLTILITSDGVNSDNDNIVQVSVV